MSKIFSDITQLIGGTPLIELTNFNRRHGLLARVAAKLECFNPAGSVKDRVALSLILDAEQKGLLKDGAVIIEPTSGNTGIGLAALAAAKGYRLILTMPDSMSAERQKLLRAYGAELVLTDGALGMKGAIEKSQELQKAIPGAFIPGQFTNPANPAAHFDSTGPEIWEATDGTIDILVAGVGTGGTVSGAGAYLKSKNPAIRVIAVEPAQSPVLSGGKSGAHKIQGIGAGFIPDVLDTAVYDEVIAVSDEDAILTTRAVAQSDGILAGISSGAALNAAKKIALRPGNTGKLIAVIFPDSGERYLSIY